MEEQGEGWKRKRKGQDGNKKIDGTNQFRQKQKYIQEKE